MLEDLERKMVFLSGPRQVGKTTLARQVLERVPHEDQVYLNWDRGEHRKTIRELAWSRSAPVAVLDEVHNYARWKVLLKGFHDTDGQHQRLLVTGSARLGVPHAFQVTGGREATRDTTPAARLLASLP